MIFVAERFSASTTTYAKAHWRGTFAGMAPPATDSKTDSSQAESAFAAHAETGSAVGEGGGGGVQMPSSPVVIRICDFYRLEVAFFCYLCSLPTPNLDP